MRLMLAGWNMEPLYLVCGSFVVYVVLMLLFAQEPLGFDLLRRFRR